ncbi:hypothetical protein [uncultured Nostoc sp.]|uniref:hypothetical protein n=1 Tax=uncultured Nostoc sp. TaxID=340711 RepID=UPI0035CBA773
MPDTGYREECRVSKQALYMRQGETRESLQQARILDGDVILAAQAILQLKSFDEVIVITTNLKHISLFESKEICIVDW